MNDSSNRPDNRDEAPPLALFNGYEVLLAAHRGRLATTMLAQPDAPHDPRNRAQRRAAAR